LRPSPRNRHRRNYFFKLSSFQKPLLDFYKKNPGFIQPETRRNEIISFVEGGLKDLSITRTTIRWAFPSPVKSRTSFTSGSTRSPPISAPSAARIRKARLLPADLHLVGKDIIRFHAVYWPAFLMAAMLLSRNKSGRMAGS